MNTKTGFVVQAHKKKKKKIKTSETIKKYIFHIRKESHTS